MLNAFSNALSALIVEHVRLSKSRQETLVWLVLLVMRQGSVCLWRLAAHVGTEARVSSVRRRFQRFFQHIKLDGMAVARIIVAFLGASGKPWVLAMDRTNWAFGRVSVNILMLALVWRGIGIPLAWTLLPSSGNSDTSVRTDLLDRLRQAFPDMTVAFLTGDREFIGEDWLAWLKTNGVPFVLRLRENLCVKRQGYADQSISSLADPLKPGDKRIVKGWVRLGAGGQTPARLVLLRLKTGELLALAASGKPKQALARYRQRWTIETLFANMKTRGFNMEDTHLAAPDKLSTLIAVIALAIALSAKAGAIAATVKPVPIKKHGRKARALFSLGLDLWRKIIASHNIRQITEFITAVLNPKSPRKPSKMLNFLN